MTTDLFKTLGKATKPDSKDLKRLEVIPLSTYYEVLGKPKKTIPQWKKILVWLLAGHSLTGMEAQRMFGCEALTQRIAQLRNEKGYNKEESPNCYIPNPAELIKTSTGKWIAKYTLIQK